MVSMGERYRRFEAASVEAAREFKRACRLADVSAVSTRVLEVIEVGPVPAFADGMVTEVASALGLEEVTS